MRGLNRVAVSPGRPIAAALFLKPYSTSFGDGGSSGGGGRGRGRGSGSPPTPPTQARVPGQPVAAVGDEDSFPSFGHGRGHPPFPSTAGLPPFTSLMPSTVPSPSAGRGRGRASPPSSPTHPSSSPPPSPPPPPPPPPPPSLDPQPKKPIFFRRQDSDSPQQKSPFVDSGESATLPPNLSPLLFGSGRGKPTRSAESEPAPAEENRHLRDRGQPIGRRPPWSSTDPVRRAADGFSRGGPSGPGGRARGGRDGRGGRGMVGTWRGRGGRSRGGRGRGDDDDEFDLYLGDNADGERLEKRLGEEKMKILAAGFEAITSRVLPSPLDEAYLDALHTNNLIEYEPEYIMEFDRNPDIDEKPPMSLEEFLVTAKPFLMSYTGMNSQEEWEEAIEELQQRIPYLKELVDCYSGPDRVTAKQQQAELEGLANTLPTNIPSSVRRFADRAVLSLQSNPGWAYHKKCQFMDKLVRDVSEHYK